MNLKEIKGVFVLPKKKYYLGKIIFGTPYLTPRKFNKNFISIKKLKPKYDRNPNFDLFGYHISYGFPIYYTKGKLGWKDKFNSPRFEWCPSFYLFFFKWQLVISLHAPDYNDDKYYEMILWYLEYCDKDIKKAKETWGWIDSDGKSTWEDKYMLYSLQDIRDKKIKEILK